LTNIKLENTKTNVNCQKMIILVLFVRGFLICIFTISIPMGILVLNLKNFLEGHNFLLATALPASYPFVKEFLLNFGNPANIN